MHLIYPTIEEGYVVLTNEQILAREASLRLSLSRFVYALLTMKKFTIPSVACKNICLLLPRGSLVGEAPEMMAGDNVIVERYLIKIFVSNKEVRMLIK